MKAIVYTKYGSPDVLQLKDVEKPTPKDAEVLIKIHAASVNAYDWHFLTADIFLIRLMGGGLLKPKYTRLGADVAGRVEAVGSNVKQFQPDDEVFGMVQGGFAEYACAPENAVALKPSNLSFEEAAAVPMAAITALQGLRDAGQIQPGQKVLINGASGGVGTFAVQIAKLYGAEVTAVCSTRNLDQARSLGADHVIDYTQEDFTQNGQQYDLILAVNGYHPLSAYKRALAPKGSLYHGWRFHGSNLPGDAPGIVDVNIRGQENGRRSGETRPEGFGFSQRASGSRHSRPCYRSTVSVK